MTEQRKTGARSTTLYRDPDGTLINAVPPIDVSTVNRPGSVIELDEIPIEGSRSRAATLPSLDAGRDASGRSRMVPDWVPDWAITALGQPVEDDRTGVTGYEVPAWAAELVADSDGQMPTGMLGASAEFASNLVPGRAPYRMFTGVEPSREARTINPLSATMGAVDAASLGFADDIAGAFSLSTGRELADARRYSQQQDPGSFAIGEAGGSLPQMLIPGLQARQGASTAARVGLGAAEGAGWGALEGVGRSDADSLGGRLLDAAPGAAIGGVLGGGLAGGAARMERRAAQPVDGDEVERLLDSAALERLGQAGGSQALSSRRMRMLAPGSTPREQIASARRTVDRMREYGAFDGGILPPGPDAVAARVAQQRERAIADMDRIAGRMETEAVDPQPLMTHMEQRIESLDRIPGAEADANRMRALLSRFQERAQQGDMSMRDLQEWKSYWGRRTDPNSASVSEQEARDVYRAITDNMQQGVTAVDPQLGTDYQRARHDYHIGEAFDEMIGHQAMDQARLRKVSLSDYLTGLEGFRNGGILRGLGGIVLNRGLRRNEHGIAAQRLERQAERLRTAPQRYGAWAQRLQAAQARGPRAFAAALYTAAQSDEAVRAQLAQQEDEQQIRDQAIEALPEVPFDALDEEQLPEVSFDDLDELLGD